MIPAREISKRLAAQAEAVCIRMLPGGKRVKDIWQCGDLSGNPGKSLNVHLDGQRQGRWCDWANQDQDKGDMLDLWASVRGIALPEAIREAKEWLGIAEPTQQKERQYAKPRNGSSGDLSDKAKAFLTKERKLSGLVVARFKVKGVPTQGDKVEAIAFPSYSVAGDIVNHSYRTLPPKPKEVWQDKGCAPALFGWHALEDSAFISRSVLLCEGQIDAMTWTQWGINALSIPNGSGQTWIEYEWNNLAAFDTIYLSFDMDGAGRENSEKTIQRLGRHRCMIVKLPEKDANDCLCAGFTNVDALRWIEEAKPPVFRGMVRGSEMEKRLLEELREKPVCFTLPFFDLHWPKQGLYFRPSEVSVWTGHPGHGKSTFLTFLMCYAVSMKQTTFVGSFEVKAEKTLAKMFRAGSKNHDEVAASRFVLHYGPSIIIADHVGYIAENALFEMMMFAFQRYGTTQYVIDSFMRIEGLEEDFPAQGKFMNRLQEFAKQTGAHVHIVAHPRKGPNADGRPGMMDVKGSALIPGNADNIVAVVKNSEKAKKFKDGTITADERRTMHDTEIIVEKQREDGWTGTFQLRFDPNRYTFHSMKPPPVITPPTDSNQYKN